MIAACAVLHDASNSAKLKACQLWQAFFLRFPQSTSGEETEVVGIARNYRMHSVPNDVSSYNSAKELSMRTRMIIKPLQRGLLGAGTLLAIYFVVVGLISGMNFALDQFARFWHFIVPLAIGFGIQLGLYTYLKDLVGQHGASSRVVAVSGTTSTAAMASCCAHYLVNMLPILGGTGFLIVVAEYQVELFWIGLLFSAAGIAYILSKVVQATREHQKC
jgi:hypothetical protein